MSKITITLDETKNRKDYYECAEVLLEENGVKQKRVVEISSLLEAFTKSSVEKPRSIRLGRLPMGFYDGTICEEHGLLHAEVLIILPKSRQMMQYETTRYDVYIPSLVFYFSVSDSRLCGTRVFALKDEWPNEQSSLYVYPFGNVNTYSGSVCWGANRLQDINRLKDLEAVVALFLQSGCNEDHYKAGVSCELKEMPLRGLFEELKKKNSFPEEWLVRRVNAYDCRTIEDLVKQFKMKK